MSKVLDVRGEKCPEPVVRVAQILEEAANGQEVKVLTDNEECVRYISDLVNVAGVGAVSIIEREDYYELIIVVKHV